MLEAIRLSTVITPGPVSLATNIHTGTRGSEGLGRLGEERAAPSLATSAPSPALGFQPVT